MGSGDIWTAGVFWAAYATVFFLPFYLPVGVFTVAAKAERTTIHDILLSGLVFVASVHVGIALVGLLIAQGQNVDVYSVLASIIAVLTVVVYVLSVIWLGFTVARGLRPASSNGDGATTREFVYAQVALSALIVEVTAGILLVYGIAVDRTVPSESLPNLSYPHLNPLSYVELIPIAASALLLGARASVHLRGSAHRRSPTSVVLVAAATSALFAVLWWAFTWYFVVMLVIMFYVWVAQVFVVISKFTAANNTRYFGASAALAAWIAVVWAFWGIAGIHWDT